MSELKDNRSLPGTTLLDVAKSVFPQRDYNNIFVPTVRDLQEEYSETVAQGRPLKASWVRVRGYCSFGSAFLAQSLFSLLVSLHGKPPGQVPRIAGWAFAADRRFGGLILDEEPVKTNDEVEILVRGGCFVECTSSATSKDPDLHGMLTYVLDAAYYAQIIDARQLELFYKGALIVRAGQVFFSPDCRRKVEEVRLNFFSRNGRVSVATAAVPRLLDPAPAGDSDREPILALADQGRPHLSLCVVDESEARLRIAVAWDTRCPKHSGAPNPEAEDQASSREGSEPGDLPPSCIVPGDRGRRAGPRLGGAPKLPICAVEKLRSYLALILP